MDKFIETHKLPRLNHDETGNLNRPITSKEIDSVIKSLSTKQNPEPDGSTGEFYQTCKENQQYSSQILTFFPKIEEEETLLNSFTETSITLIPKPDKDTIRKLQIHIPDED